MEHPDWPAFVAAIVSDPDDDTTRLVAADFLEENGDADRAAFIRIQVQLARLEALGQGRSPEADRLRAKERGYLGPLSVHPVWWGMAECPELVRMKYTGPLAIERVGGADRLVWCRGFVEMVRCPAEVWLRHGEAVRKRQPVRHAHLTGCDGIDREAWYAGLGSLTGLQSVGLADGEPGLAVWLEMWLPGTTVSEIVI